MHIISIGGTLYELSKSLFLENVEKIFQKCRMLNCLPKVRYNSWDQATIDVTLKIIPYENRVLSRWRIITKTRLFKYIENFTSKNWKNSDNKIWYFHISAQNIDCGYSLEPPRRGGSNEYPQSMFLRRNKTNNVYPFKPHFYYIKVGF